MAKKTTKKATTKKKATAKKTTTKKATSKKKATTKKKVAAKKRTSGADLQKKILSFMRKGKAYTSREVVEGLGRKPGAKEGGPVVRQLHKLAADDQVKHGPDEGHRGYVWVKK